MPPPISDPDHYWSLTVDITSYPLDRFIDNGLPSLPVVIRPTNGTSIRSKNQKVLIRCLEQVTTDFRDISEVRQYERDGIVCRSRNLTVVQTLLTTRSFGGLAVEAFVPHHLACVKGVVRGVDVILPACELIELFDSVGALEAFRCSRLDNDKRVPTESVIVTFASHTCPSEVKSWPLIFRVDAFHRRVVQCRHCFRFGHVTKNCKSDVCCRRCGHKHEELACPDGAQLKCRLCGDPHYADCETCSSRDQEVLLLEIMDSRHCLRYDALAALRGRGPSFARKAQRPVDGDLEKMISAAVEAAVAKLREEISPMITMLASFFPPLQEAEAPHASNNTSIPSAEPIEHMPTHAPPSRLPAPSQPQPQLTDAESADLEMDSVSAIPKRGVSPPSPGHGTPGGKRNRKGNNNMNKFDTVTDVLAAAVAESILSDG
ncbi:uncharacterized protein LOC135389685 [Ornithodoros turicata]|uniref:uncharacterized protein LOC135389685 n=1 Tax=Ornithodoros turicata TaxID=34597 RepID=UPI003139326B